MHGDMAEPVVQNVSDTARWVAHHRAVESTRWDALFRDPYAARLAGDRGAAIASKVPRSARNGWFIIARTKIIDRYLARSIEQGCDRVLNLAAGLDTRPYRLPLPSSLRWIEADLPALIDEKERVLSNETPRCALSREKVDLADEAARRAFLDRALDGAKNALVLTEGLLPYLRPSVVRSLGLDFAARGAIRWWVVDFSSPMILQMMRKQMKDILANAPMHFAPENGVTFFEELGWRATEVESLMHAAARFGRLPLLLRLVAKLPAPDPRNPGKHARWSAVVRLERRA